MKCKKRRKAILQETIVFCKAVSAAMLCAASTDKGGGQTAAAVHTAQKSTAACIDTKPESARQPVRTAAYTAAHRHKGNEAAIRKRRFAFIISLQDCQPPTRHPPPPVLAVV